VQEPDFATDLTLMEVAKSGLASLLDLQRELEEAAAEMAGAEDDDDSGPVRDEEHLGRLTARADLHYHVAHCNLKVGNSAAALAALVPAWSLYERCQDRRKKMTVLQLRCLSHAAAGKQREAEADIAALRGMCLMPLEDPDKEVAELHALVERRFKEAVPPASMPRGLVQSRWSWPAMKRAFVRFFQAPTKDENVGGLLLTSLLLSISAGTAIFWLRGFLDSRAGAGERGSAWRGAPGDENKSEF
jgi:hypothetical protein